MAMASLVDTAVVTTVAVAALAWARQLWRAAQRHHELIDRLDPDTPHTSKGGDHPRRQVVHYTRRMLTHTHVHDDDTTPGSGVPEPSAHAAILALDPPIHAAILAKDCETDDFALGLQAAEVGGVSLFCGYEIQENVVHLLAGDPLPQSHVLHCPELQLDTVVHPNYYGEFCNNFLNRTAPITEVWTKQDKAIRLNGLEVRNKNYTGRGLCEDTIDAAFAMGYRFVLTAGDDNLFRAKDVFAQHYSHVKLPAWATTREGVADAVRREAVVASEHPGLDFTVEQWCDAAAGVDGAAEAEQAAFAHRYTSTHAGTWTVTFPGANYTTVKVPNAAAITITVPPGTARISRVVFEHDLHKTWFQPVVHETPKCGGSASVLKAAAVPMVEACEAEC